MLYHDSHFNENSCAVQDDGCVVDWGRRNLVCPYLRGVYFKGRYYEVDSPEFESAFDGEADDHSLIWDCSHKA